MKKWWGYQFDCTFVISIIVYTQEITGSQAQTLLAPSTLLYEIAFDELKFSAGHSGIGLS